MTNAVPLIQLAQQVAVPLQHAGYNVSGAEMTLALTLAGAVCAALTHAAHLAVNGWQRVGGWDGFRKFLRTGNARGNQSNSAGAAAK
ncbi:MAG TPA: hypothetical protein VGV18_00235 [Verrucomicrobiae bacterium]|nr:hypothetical protein [Verrucomicrobiae bacterium]